MDASPARRQDADAPVAELVAHALDDDRRGIGNGPSDGDLIPKVLQKILRGACIEIVFPRQAIDRRRGRQAHEVVHQSADGEAELQRPAGAIAFPERHLAGFAGSGRDEHAVVRDFLDAP